MQTSRTSLEQRPILSIEALLLLLDSLMFIHWQTMIFLNVFVTQAANWTFNYTCHANSLSKLLPERESGWIISSGECTNRRDTHEKIQFSWPRSAPTTYIFHGTKSILAQQTKRHAEPSWSLRGKYVESSSIDFRHNSHCAHKLISLLCTRYNIKLRSYLSFWK